VFRSDYYQLRQLQPLIRYISSDAVKMSVQDHPQISLYRLKVESLGYISAADSMGLFSLSFSCGLRKMHFSAVECISAVQRHPRSYWSSLINSNFGPVLNCF